MGVELGATVVRTAVSRTVIDVNRDPGGASLYPGQPTTELCPRTTFDGVPLYAPGVVLDGAYVFVALRLLDMWIVFGLEVEEPALADVLAQEEKPRIQHQPGEYEALVLAALVLDEAR